MDPSKSQTPPSRSSRAGRSSRATRQSRQTESPRSRSASRSGPMPQRPAMTHRPLSGSFALPTFSPTAPSLRSVLDDENIDYLDQRLRQAAPDPHSVSMVDLRHATGREAARLTPDRSARSSRSSLGASPPQRPAAPQLRHSASTPRILLSKAEDLPHVSHAPHAPHTAPSASSDDESADGLGASSFQNRLVPPGAAPSAHLRVHGVRPARSSRPEKAEFYLSNSNAGSTESLSHGRHSSADVTNSHVTPSSAISATDSEPEHDMAAAMADPTTAAVLAAMSVPNAGGLAVGATRDEPRKLPDPEADPGADNTAPHSGKSFFGRLFHRRPSVKPSEASSGSSDSTTGGIELEKMSSRHSGRSLRHSRSRGESQKGKVRIDASAVPEKPEPELPGNSESERLAHEAAQIVNLHMAAHGRPAAAPQETTESKDSFTVPAENLLRSEIEAGFTEQPLGAYDEYDSEFSDSEDAIREPPKVKQGILSSLLRLYQNPLEGKSSETLLGSTTSSFDTRSRGRSREPRSRGGTPTGSRSPSRSRIGQMLREPLAPLARLGAHRRGMSYDNIRDLMPDAVQASETEFAHAFSGKPDPADASKGATRRETDPIGAALPKFERKRPKKPSGPARLKPRRRLNQVGITVHIANVLQRQRFILRLCMALMLYGAPTHRLEEYMRMTAKVLQIDAQFLYLPGCMIVSFGDSVTRTSEVQLVRCNQGLNLWKLHEAHRIYKEVVHDLVGVAEASDRLEMLVARPNLYPWWVCVLVFGFSSAMVAPFAFSGGWRDMPICFGLGACVGFLQLKVAPRSNLYSNVFEVTASIVVSFVGRAIGSVGSHETFCFGAIAQGSLALILPGYIILTGSLELQSRNLVAGAVRMFYAIVYSLFLGFGITLGAALYGWIDHDAVSTATCSDTVSPWFRFIFVPCFTIGLALVNQAHWRQLPIMVIIACAGYVVTYFSGTHFSAATEITSAIGAFLIGVLGNLYSRIGRGLAVSAMLPAIFVQVPSGVAAQASLLSGVTVADNITKSHSGAPEAVDSAHSISFGMAMIEVSIGITVGLFAAAIVVYPLGKKHTAVFTF